MKTLWDRIVHYLPVQDRAAQNRTAKESEQWLDDPALSRAIAKIRARTIDAWKSSRDPATRERAWLMMWAVDAFVDELTVTVENEKIELLKEARADERERERDDT